MKTKLPKSRSPRVDIMCGNDDSLETLRFRRDLAARDGDLEHAMQIAILIDRKKPRSRSAARRHRETHNAKDRQPPRNQIA
jgi:hypothetical protein